jgi:hypothetical protein
MKKEGNVMYYKHGMSNTPTYKSWIHMFQRCKNPNNKYYKDYGERGITICERWYDFRNFFEDMGTKPNDLTLDRVNNSGNYEPGNCRWATPSQQRINSRPISCGPCQQRYFEAQKDGCQFTSNNQNKFARQYGLTRRSIGHCLCGIQKTHKGWKFQWLNLGG